MLGQAACPVLKDWGQCNNAVARPWESRPSPDWFVCCSCSVGGDKDTGSLLDSAVGDVLYWSCLHLEEKQIQMKSVFWVNSECPPTPTPTPPYVVCVYIMIHCLRCVWLCYDYKLMLCSHYVLTARMTHMEVGHWGYYTSSKQSQFTHSIKAITIYTLYQRHHTLRTSSKQSSLTNFIKTIRIYTFYWNNQTFQTSSKQSHFTHFVKTIKLYTLY